MVGVPQQISACNHHTLFVLAWRIPSCVSGNNLKQTFFQGRQDVYLADNSLFCSHYMSKILQFCKIPPLIVKCLHCLNNISQTMRLVMGEVQSSSFLLHVEETWTLKKIAWILKNTAKKGEKQCKKSIKKVFPAAYCHEWNDGWKTSNYCLSVYNLLPY